MHSSAARACVNVLEAFGVEVDFPQSQTCCGQPWINSGNISGAQRLARHFLDVFESADAIVAPSSSCVDTVRNHYSDLFASSSGFRDRMTALGKKTYEFCEYLHKVVGIRDFPAHPHPLRTTYHSSCKTLRGLGLRGAAEHYLTEMLGEAFVPLPQSETCCGFGGSFSVKLPEISGKLMADKLRNIEQTKASVVTSLDLGCLTHLSGGAGRSGLSQLRFVHLAELMAEALAGGSSPR